MSADRFCCVLGATLILACISVGASLAEDYGERYVVKTGLYPTVVVNDRGYRIPIYLPYGSLFFLDTEPSARAGHISVISQFGQKYLIPREHKNFRSGAKRTVENVYGNQDYIFHGNHTICPAIRNDGGRYIQCDEDEAVPVTRGDVAKIVNDKDPDFVELMLFKKDGETAFIDRNDLKILVNRGLVTNLRETHPRYIRLKRVRVSLLSAKCGEVIKSVSVKKLETNVKGKVGVSIGKSFSPWTLLKSVVGIEVEAEASVSAGRTTTDTITLSQKLGGDGYGVETSVLFVKDMISGTIRQFDIYTETRCIKRSRRKPEIFISRLEIYEKGRDSTLVEIEFDEIYDWDSNEALTTQSAPYRVWELNNQRLFLTSINSRADYWNIHGAFLRDTKDAALANLFISEFNASCARRRRESDGIIPYSECRQTLAVKSAR